jgi:DNA modification methylase
MPFTFHPPTGRACKICEQLNTSDPVQPIVDVHSGKASSANQFAFHNWFNFVLGYSPQFPEYMLRRENSGKQDLIIDPFMGSGTTLLVCKQAGIPSKGIDANDFMVDAARTKLAWTVNLDRLKQLQDEVLQAIEAVFGQYDWGESAVQLPLFAHNIVPTRDYKTLLSRRPKLLLEKYISDKPFAKAVLIDDVIEQQLGDDALRPIFNLALTSIIVPISNIRYGPGFGVAKPKDDMDVLSLYTAKLNRMISDLVRVEDWQRATPAEVCLGDARQLTNYFAPDSAAMMVTSPPYPGDHEYTKHTKLELLFRGYAENHKEFQTIKKRMIRASTTNLYVQDADREPIQGMESICAVTDEIQRRLEEDRATSGFEKLYTKLVWEYFGGMYKALAQCLQVLRPGGKIALLVSDSHAFKMVHIQTAVILSEVGVRAGFINPEIILWQNKTSTSHNYFLRENILILQKPYRS